LDPNIGEELYKVMDALVALRLDLECDPEIPGETLVLSAEKARDACDAIESATESIKHLAATFGDDAPGEDPLH